LTLWFSVCVGFIALKFAGGFSFKYSSWNKKFSWVIYYSRK